MVARKPPTMADVAALAGVSVPTVSRVLSGTHPVSTSKREAVEASIAALGFRPSAAARMLVTRRSGVIAIVAGDTTRYGYAEAIRGVEESARAAGYTVMITVVESDEPDDVDRAVAATMSHPSDGAVVLKFDPPGVAALSRIPTDLPLVALSGSRARGVLQAVLDETRAGELLTEHLLSLGHRTVHHVAVPPSRREDGRTTGWRRALARAGAPVPEVLRATWEPASGVAIGRRLVNDGEATAVFCGNDEIAMGVVHGIRAAGADVPTDISVAGFDDHPLASLWSPPLTTVKQDFADLGRRGFQLLLDEINGVERTRKLSSLLPDVVVRESTAPPRTP